MKPDTPQPVFDPEAYKNELEQSVVAPVHEIEAETEEAPATEEAPVAAEPVTVTPEGTADSKETVVSEAAEAEKIETPDSLPAESVKEEEAKPTATESAPQLLESIPPTQEEAPAEPAAEESQAADSCMHSLPLPFLAVSTLTELKLLHSITQNQGWYIDVQDLCYYIYVVDEAQKVFPSVRRHCIEIRGLGRSRLSQSVEPDPHKGTPSLGTITL